jgi:hypothetical protein
MIELSVCLPLFRAKYCAWIVLESLCRQQNIDFEWELIITEETFQESFGMDNIMNYVNRLKNVGCKRLKYLPLGLWVPLSNKIILMTKNCSKDSKIYTSVAADVYSPPQRLKSQYDLFKNRPEVDWAANGKTIVYDIKSEKTYLNDASLAKTISDATGRSVRMRIMRNFKFKNIRKGIDGTVFRFVEKFVESKGKVFTPYVDYESNSWMYGLNVHGLNNITMGLREQRFAGINRPPNIMDCPIDINTTIPIEIMRRLRKSKRYLNTHNKTGIRGL